MGKILASIMWDDALTTDLRIIDLLKKLDIMSSFAISPRRHCEKRIQNDQRSLCFGEIVSKKELKEFGDFEVFNHTANHKELTTVSLKIAQLEINEGKKELEDLFEREVPGFCYPYGSTSRVLESLVERSGHSYARSSKITMSNVQIENMMSVPTSCKWFDIHKIKKQSGRSFVFWGHSYEIDSWSKLEYFYDFVKDNFEVVTFDYMIKKASCKKY